jgi:hypothetical protein
MAVNDVAELQQRVEDGCEFICNMAEILEHVWQSLTRRAMHCVEVQGLHFEHFL